MKNKPKLFYLNIIWLILCPVVAWLYVDFKTGEHEKENKKNIEVRQSGYKYISPLLECELQENDAIQKYIPFEKKLKYRIQSEIIDKNANVHISVYFRNLNNGPWFGIKERENFSPASLLKVPLMIAWFKQIEEDPSLALKEFRYEQAQAPVTSQYVKPESQMEPGNSYTVEELTHRMIVGSDNEAMSILLSNIPRGKLNAIYQEMGVINPIVTSTDNYMSVKDYASFFRILYNSAYLNRQSSEKALELLSQVEFRKGLVEGTGGDLTVAHKFGERGFSQEDDHLKQLHDCGIVYYPKYPYLLCVMTRGDDFDHLVGVIANVARTVQEEVGKKYP